MPNAMVSYDAVSQTAKNKLLQAVLYLNESERQLVEHACDYAFVKHDGQTRKSGEPYITHPIAVATEVASWKLDAKTIVSALLHDVLEDTGTTKAELASEFDETVAAIVDGLSKLEKIHYDSYVTHQAESFRKMVLAMVKDLRVLVIKLSDRLHNMRTLGSMRPEKCRRIAQETLETYAQLANRIGMNPVYRELQDLSFLYLYPKRYRILEKAIQQWRIGSREKITEILSALTTQLVAFNIEAKVLGREKHLYSIFNKMRNNQLRFSEVMDLYCFRIVVNSIPDCYRTLGALHSLYKPHPKRFKDFIAIPKSNGYQSLHTTLIGPLGLPIEIQIRTPQMNEIAELGMARQWIYQNHTNDSANTAHIRTHQWLQNIMDIQSDNNDAIEFSQNIKDDLCSNEVYIFTPQGEIVVLPQDATPVDFAYAVHTDIGHNCIGAKVNNILVPLRHKLETGDTVEIMTQKNGNPNPTWLSFVVSARARSAIRSRLKNMDRHDAIALGEKLLQKVLQDLLPEEVITSEKLSEKYLTYLQQNQTSFEEVLYNIGMGHTLPISIAVRLAELAGKHLGKNVRLSPIKISGNESGNIHFPTCCHPIPGDSIKAVLTPNQGLVIHNDSCPHLIKSPPEKTLDANWDNIQSDLLFRTRILVSLRDGQGLLATMASVISANQANIASVDTPNRKEDKDGFIDFIFEIQIKDANQLEHIIHDLQSIPHVCKVSRM